MGKNRGQLIQPIAGISGVGAGGVAQATLGVGKRFKRLVFQTSAVNYTGGVARTPVNIVSATPGVPGTATIRLNVTNGVVTSVTLVTGNSASYTVGDTLTVPDPTGTGLILTVATVAGGALATFTITNSGTASPCSPAFFFGSNPVMLSVDGTVMRDIYAQDILNINAINGHPDEYGQLSIHFSEPWRKLTKHPDITAWDLTPNADGAPTHTSFDFKAQISSVISLPQLTGVAVFDYLTTARTSSAGVTTRVVMPITQHRLVENNLATGQNTYTNVPCAKPIVRLWALGSVPGNITELDIIADKVWYLQATQEAMAAVYGPLGFTFNQLPNSTVSAAATSYTANGSIASNAFDAGYISDPDQRLGEKLTVSNELQVNIWNTSNGQNVVLVIEYSPGAYTG